MNAILFTLLTAVVTLSFTSDEPTLAQLAEGQIALSINGKISLPVNVKAKQMSGSSIGNKSHIEITDTTQMVVVSKSDALVIFARVYATNRSCPFSIVKANKTDKGYGASSYFGELVKEPKTIESVPYTSKETDKKLRVFTITPNKSLESGMYILNFNMSDGKKFILTPDNLGNRAVLLKITE